MSSDFVRSLEKLQALLDKFKDNYLKYKDRYTRTKLTYENKVEEQEKRGERVKTINDGLEIKRESLDVLNQVAEVYDEYSVRRKLEKVITSIIQTLFCQDNFEFVIMRSTTRNQQEVHFFKSVEEKGQKFHIPIEREPGGLGDIVDIIFRVLILHQFPPNQRFLIMDEPIKNLSKGLRPRFNEFFARLRKEFGIKFLIITHESEHMDNYDRHYYFSYNGNRTVVKEVEGDMYDEG